MGSLSGLAIGLSFVFGCILMGIFAELYYFLWWKKRISYSNTTKIEDLLCWKKPKALEKQEDLEMGSRSRSKPHNNEESVEAELMRIHNLCGPPRFLFTIKEESKEDLDSEDGKSRKGSRTKSLSDLFTPLSSPTTLKDSYHNHNHGFNPLFTDTDFNTFKSSPPPKFKFLKDAEDKLITKMLMEEAARKCVEDSQDSRMESQDSRMKSQVKLSKQAAQVLPLPSSPTFKTNS